MGFDHRCELSQVRFHAGSLVRNEACIPISKAIRRDFTVTIMRYFTIMQPLTLSTKEFPDQAACKSFVIEMPWPDGARCHRCTSKERIYYALKTRPFHCVCCNLSLYQ